MIDPYTHQRINTPVKPFLLFNPKQPPDCIATKWRNEQDPILAVMEEAIGMMPLLSNIATIQDIDRMYDQGTAQVKQRANYIWIKEGKVQ